MTGKQPSNTRHYSRQTPQHPGAPAPSKSRQAQRYTRTQQEADHCKLARHTCAGQMLVAAAAGDLWCSQQAKPCHHHQAAVWWKTALSPPDDHAQQYVAASALGA